MDYLDSVFTTIETLPLLMKIALVVSFYFMWKLIIFEQEYSTIINWWRTHDGDRYDSKFNLQIVLAAGYSYPMYYYFKLTQGNLFNDLSMAQILFVKDVCLPFTKGAGMSGKIDPRYNFLLPRHLVVDIRFAKGENIMFDQYVAKKGLDPAITLTYDAKGNPSSKGVYPALSDTGGWLLKLREWCGGKGYDWISDESGVYRPYAISADGRNEGMNKKMVAMQENWFNIVHHPDNIFAFYGIPMESVLILSFINGLYMDPETNIKLDAQAAKNLFGGMGMGNLGGWIGFLQGASGMTYDDYKNLWYSKYITKNQMVYQRPCPPKKSFAEKALGFVGNASGLGSIAMFMQTPATKIGVALFGIALGGATSYFDEKHDREAQKNCNPN